VESDPQPAGKADRSKKAATATTWFFIDPPWVETEAKDIRAAMEIQGFNRLILLE
jgi:hypothetical protein